MIQKDPDQLRSSTQETAAGACERGSGSSINRLPSRDNVLRVEWPGGQNVAAVIISMLLEAEGAAFDPMASFFFGFGIRRCRHFPLPDKGPILQS